MIEIRYSEMLRTAISESKKSLHEVGAECERKGVSITGSYLSQLQNGKMAPASDRVNKVLAQVLGLDAQELRIAAYAERVPPDILAQLAEKTNHSRQP